MSVLHPDLHPFVSHEHHTEADYRALADAQRRRTVKVFSRETQCLSKRKLSTEEEARKTMKRMRKLGLTHYHCDYCGWWHVGRAR